MKQLYNTLFLFSFLFFLSGCLEDPEMDTRLQNASAPELENFEIPKENITATTLLAKATVKSENGAPLKIRGFKYWPENDESQYKEVKETENIGKGEYKLPIEGLINGIYYKITPFASNDKGIGYGDTLRVSTQKGIGEVKTSEIDKSTITATTVVVEGIITDQGEGEITDFGFYLYLDKDTTFFSSKKGSQIDRIDTTFVYTITNLKPETSYTVEAFTKNTFGDFNSKGKKSFTTKDGRPILADSIEHKSDYDFVSLKSKLLSKGDAEIEEIGFSWSTVKAPNRPNIEEDDTIQCVLNKDSIFEGILTELNAETNYYVRAYVKNVFGIVYSKDSILVHKKRDIPTVSLNDPSTYIKENGIVTIGGKIQDMGKSTVKSLVLYYSTTPAPGPANNGGFVNCLDSLKEDGSFTIPVKLKGGLNYYVKVFAENESGTASSEDVTLLTIPKIFTNITLDKLSFPGKDGRQQFGLFVFDDLDLAFVTGGDLGSICTDELYTYNSGKWQQLVPYPNKMGLMQMSVCSKGNVAYVLGGRSKAQFTTSCLSYRYNEWKNIQSLNNDMACIDATSFVYDNSIILLGGKRPDEAVLDTVYRYDINANMWNNGGRFPVPIAGGVALSSGDSVFVGLGYHSGERGWWINSSGDWKEESWKKLADIPTEMGSVSSGVIQGSNCYFIDDHGVIWLYNITEDKWYRCSKVEINKPSVPSDYRMFILNDTIHILVMNILSDTVFRTYDPVWDLPQAQNEIENEQN